MILDLDFYDTPKWQRLRYRVLKKRNGCCECCGARGSFHNPLQVDHIKPRSKYPELEWDINNLQTLCKDCNEGKGAWDETDWRQSAPPPDTEQREGFRCVGRTYKDAAE